MVVEPLHDFQSIVDSLNKGPLYLEDVTDDKIHL